VAARGSHDMRRFATIVAAGLAGLLLVGGCAGQRVGGRPSGPNPRQVSDQELNIRLMLSYDGNSDGTVTRANQSERAGFGLQRRYDIAYAQCMYDKGASFASLHTGQIIPRHCRRAIANPASLETILSMCTRQIWDRTRHSQSLSCL
jgi:hypothetical protein